MDSRKLEQRRWVYPSEPCAAERELKVLKANDERMEELDSLPGLIEEYIRELPYLVQGPQRPIRDYVMKEGLREETLIPHRLTLDMFRERTPEEKEELRQAEETKRGLRYRAMYELLGLKKVVQKDGTLDVSGTFGVRSMELGAEPTAVWKSVTRENGEGLTPPDSFLKDEEDRCHNLRVPRRTQFLWQGSTKSVEPVPIKNQLGNFLRSAVRGTSAQSVCSF